MSDRTVVCVLGMHRSGTSLVSQLLHALGLDLGPEEHLMRPSPANPQGHWENEPIHEINEAILACLGGSWSEPPDLPPGWEGVPELADLRRDARALVQTEFSDSKRWGFKDPRTCLTLPFWQRILPPMRYVICLRNPVDVAFSLGARELEPLEFEHGAELWLTYVRATLAATAGHPQLVLFYEDLMSEPKPVIRRLADFIGNERGEAGKAEVRVATRVALSQSLWHHRTPIANVIEEPRLPFHVKSLYLALRLSTSGAEGVRTEALELLGASAVRNRDRYADLERWLSERHADLDRIRAARREEQQRREQLQRELAATRRRLNAEIEEANAELEQARGDLQEARGELQDARGELEEARAEVRQLEASTSEAASDAPKLLPAGEPRDEAHEQLLDDVRARAREVIDSGATVLVASKGDEELLRLDGHRACHFPVGSDDGRYLGYHPAGDTAVIAQLEALRASGADHLLLPEPTLWWLDYYHGLRRHLEERYALLLKDERCAIYRLRGESRDAETGPLATLKRAVAVLRTRSSIEPSILDWGTGLEVADQFPELPVFEPPADGEALPYLGRSVDVVVLLSRGAARLADARRVAISAVVAVDPEFPEVAELEWLSDAASGWGEDANVILLPSPGEPAWEATLRGFAETLDPGFAGELTVTGASDALERAGDAGAAAGVPTRLVETAPGASLSRRARAATEAVDKRIQVFVTAPAVPLPGWLPSILALFARKEGTGAVGARIVSPLGVLEEAGGIVTADGSRRRRGEGDQDPDRPEYCFVRRVDFCSPPLLATSRDVLERMHGLENGGASPLDALVDFSLRAGKAGASVYYQPEARVVRIGEQDR